ncbi:hypothetical protein QTH09_17815, partial [Clostridium perfringens]|nr:hypothetical protein [Clostridium perfringens]
MNRKKIASLILATSIVTTQVATPVFASSIDSEINVSSTEKVSDEDSTKDDSSQVSNNKSEEKDLDKKANAEEIAKNDSSQLVNSVDESNEKATKTVTDSTTTAVVNNTAEFMAALNNNSITSIKLNSDVTLINNINPQRNIDIYGNNHTLDFSESRIISGYSIKLSFNDIKLTNGGVDSWGVIYLTAAGNEVTFNNVTYNGPELLDSPNGIVNLKGNSKFITNSNQELLITGFINIADGSNIYVRNTYNPSHWDGCSVLRSGWDNDAGGLTVGNNVNLTIITENNSACLGAAPSRSFLKVGNNSNVKLSNESPTQNSWNIVVHNITQMNLADTSTLEIIANNNSWGAIYCPENFIWNLNNANVKVSTENGSTVGVIGESNGIINFGSSINLQDVSVWSKNNNFEAPSTVANDIYGTLNINGSSISSANISNPNLTSSLVNSSTNGMSKLEFGVGKVDKSQLEDLLTNK